MTARRWLGVAAYVPLIGALGWLALLCLLLLWHRETAGLYAVPYGAASALLCRRAWNIQAGEGEEPGGLELGAAGLADLILAALVLSRFA